MNWLQYILMVLLSLSVAFTILSPILGDLLAKRERHLRLHEKRSSKPTKEERRRGFR